MAARIGAGRRRIETDAPAGGRRAAARRQAARVASSRRAPFHRLAFVSGGRALAGWLLARRGAIEAALRAEGGALAHAGAAEAEALRRFRSYLMLSLAQDAPATPSLEGLRTGERRMRRLLGAWLAAAANEAGPEAAGLRSALEPFAERFLLALRETSHARRASGAPLPSHRRAVSAAIDRVCDAFFAIDVETGAIADANPAAGALLGTTRDQLLGADAMTFVPEGERESWWTELDAVSEGAEPRRFHGTLRDSGGRALAVDATLTRFATRSRTLALVLARS
jgi:PAS domain S-box-containing protein